MGFTGTRAGMTPQQRKKVRAVLLALKPRVVHHGDCVGSDAQFHNLAWTLGIPIEIHPADGKRHRAFSKGAVVTHAPKPPLKRNVDIVKASQVLLATPKHQREVLRSGTWATVRAARKEHIIIIVVSPNGDVQLEMDIGVKDLM